MLQEAIENIKSAIESGRADVMRSLIVAAEQYSKKEEAEKFSVNSVLNSNVAPEGTFLHLATKCKQLDIVRLLLAAGADPGVHNENGRNSLDLVSSNAMRSAYVEDLLSSAALGNTGRVCQLLDAGLDVNSVDNPESGNTALHWACTFGSYDMVRCLLDRKANINALNASGCTPLFDAILHDRVEIVEELLKNGANLHLKPLTGKFANISAMELAAGKPGIAALLQNYKFVTENHVPNHTDECSGSQESTIDLFNESNMELNLNSSSMNNVNEDEVSNIGIINSEDSVRIDDQLSLLWPQPQQLTRFDGKGFEITDRIGIYLDVKNDRSKLLPAMEVINRHAVRLKKYDIEHVIGALNSRTFPGSMMCLINNKLFVHQQSYKLKVTSDTICIIASDVIGLHYAFCTYYQLLGLFVDGKTIPLIQITDCPNMKYRGILLNASKDAARIPTVEHLLEIMDILAAAKVNQIFMQSKFSQHYHWPSAYSKQELLKLGYHAHNSYLSLIPALETDCYELDFESSAFQHFIQDYLSCFLNSEFLLLGPNLSSLILRNGAINKVKALCDNRTLLVTCSSSSVTEIAFSEFVLQNHIVILDHHLPKNTEDDLIHHKMNKLGITYGISSEISFTKSLCTCLDISLHRIFQKIQTIQQGSALSLTIGNWNASDCWSTMHTLPGFFLSAALGWNCQFSWEWLNQKLTCILNAHIYQDQSQHSASLIWKLNKLESVMLKASLGPLFHEKLSSLSITNSTPLYQLLMEPDDLSLEYLNMEAFQKAIKEIKHHQVEVAAFREAEVKCYTSVEEVQFVIDLLLFACRLGKSLVAMGQNPNNCMGYSVVNMGIANLHVTSQTDFANKLLSLIEAYERIPFTRYKVQSDQIVKMLTCLVERLIPRNECQDV